MRALIIRLFRSALDFLYISKPHLTSKLVNELNLSQGKGFGDSTTEIEARLSLEILEKNKIFNPIVFDVGANIGNYTNSILELNSYARIYAFEPSKVAREILEKRFVNNSSVRVIPLALGRGNMTSTLWSDVHGSGLGSLQKRRLEHFEISLSNAEQVQVVNLDSWCEENAVYPDLIKIDVEGSEFEVLIGSKETLKHARLVQFEFGGSNIDSRTFFQDFWYFFVGLNFQIFRISRHGLIHLSKYCEDEEFFKTTNYVALRNG